MVNHTAAAPNATVAPPAHAIAAVTHPDPYPFYADLVLKRPFYFDTDLKLWIASSLSAVMAVLTHPAGRVRPIGEPIPPALRGSTEREVFGALVRMNDGEARHDQPRQALVARLEVLKEGGGRLEAVAEYRAHRLADELRPWTDPNAFQQFALALPTHVIGSLLGVAEEGLGELTTLVGDLVASFSGQAAAGDQAAQRLRSFFAAEGSPTAVSNVIGLLTQAQDATAALIATTLLTLARSVRLLDSVERAPSLLTDVIDEVVRVDAPVQNTRRFLAEAATIMGESLAAGTGILVVLAATNRDPATNPEPAVFQLTRPARRDFTFGLGVHACIGRTVATTIARAGVARMLASGFDIARLDPRPAYRPYPNIRFPQLARKP